MQNKERRESLARALNKDQIEISYLLKVDPKERLAGKTLEPTTLPLTFQATRSKTMKNFKSIIWSTMLVLAISAPALAKSGTISTTKTGTISTTRTGTISTTSVGTTSANRAGTISTTRTGTISTTRTESALMSSDQSWLVELFLTVIGSW